MYVITGATGNTGKPIAQALLKAGKNVRVISRTADKAKDLVAAGAQLCEGDTSDVAFLKKAFAGATAVYALIPMEWTAPDYTASQVKHASAIAQAVKEARVNHVVTLSSQGAHLQSGSGVVLGLHKMETMFNSLENTNVLHLRPTYFMENSLSMIGLIKQAGIMGSPIKANLRFPVIASADIASYAIKRLLALDFSGKSVQDLLGQREVSYAELAHVYGAAIGKPDLPYVEFSPEDFKNAMVGQFGSSVSVADNFIQFIEAMNSGLVSFGPRTAESTTPTSIEDFAVIFARVYNG